MTGKQEHLPTKLYSFQHADGTLIKIPAENQEHALTIMDTMYNLDTTRWKLVRVQRQKLTDP